MQEGFAARRRCRRALASLAATGLVALVPVAAAGAAEDEGPTPDESVVAAVRWLGRQQRADGGFDGFLPGAATPDALLALAESAQTEDTWGTRPAAERVDHTLSEDDRTPLDAARRLARRDVDPVVAAALVNRVALPLGLDAGDDGPFGDVLDRVTEGVVDEDEPFADRVEMAVALLAAGVALPDGVLDTVLGAQQASGGWGADGDPESEAVDLATTGAAVDLLVLAGVGAEEPPLVNALRFVGGTQARSGAWPGVDDELSAVATAGAIRAIRAVGQDPEATCWQTDLGLPEKNLTASEALVALQDDDGRFGGEDPVVATSEAVHALTGAWLPQGRAPFACGVDEGRQLPFEPSLLVLGAIAVVGVGGGLRILRSAPAAY